MSEIVIRHSLSDAQRRRAAALYMAAFERKFRALLTREQGVAILTETLDAERAIVALCGAALVGVAGLHYGGRQFTRWPRAALVREFGRFGGTWRAALLRLSERPEREGQLLMDGLAVDAALRGRGIGTRLLDAVCEFARENGFDSVRLDVVDTNPRARQLYERLGFVPVKTHRLPGMRVFLGFSAYTTMIKAVA